MQWVDARLHYCQAAHGAVDFDSSCWAWEGASHRCDRESVAAWNGYRSDCSGFVTFAWGLPPVGDGGYVTSQFAPYDDAFSSTIDGNSLLPGDALNKTPDEHIILFKQWVTPGSSAVFMEEPGCSSSIPYAHEFTSGVSIHGSEVYVDYEGATFYAIRFHGLNNGGGGGPVTSADACNKGSGFCAETLQCDQGHWIVRQDDAQACTSIENVAEPCNVGGGYCTHTLQCDGGHWVPRQDDPAACITVGSRRGDLTAREGSGSDGAEGEVPSAPPCSSSGLRSVITWSCSGAAATCSGAGTARARRSRRTSRVVLVPSRSGRRQARTAHSGSSFRRWRRAWPIESACRVRRSSSWTTWSRARCGSHRGGPTWSGRSTRRRVRAR